MNLKVLGGVLAVATIGGLFFLNQNKTEKKTLSNDSLGGSFLNANKGNADNPLFYTINVEDKPIDLSALKFDFPQIINSQPNQTKKEAVTPNNIILPSSSFSSQKVAEVQDTIKKQQIEKEKKSNVFGASISEFNYKRDKDLKEKAQEFLKTQTKKELIKGSVYDYSLPTSSLKSGEVL